MPPKRKSKFVVESREDEEDLTNSKPSTSSSKSQSLTNNKENSRPTRKCVQQSATRNKAKLEEKQDEDSEDDFEPSPPKTKKIAKVADKKVKEKPKKADGKDKTKKAEGKKKAKRPLVEPDQDNNVEVKEDKNKNIILALSSMQNGGRCRSSFQLEQCARSVIVNQLKEFSVFKSVTPFDRRVTAIAWHPRKPTLCAVGSKGGEIILWKYDKDEFEGIAQGMGPGGSIQKIMFDLNSQSRIYTCSIDGTFEAKDLNRTGPTNTETFLNTQNWDKWYTSFDVAPDGMTLITGENSGFVTLLSSRGEKIWRDKLHKSKVTNIQFSPREPWLFVTTSTDNSVKIWDIRNLTDSADQSQQRKDKFLQSLVHNKAVNSAYFSNVDGTRLLTTDQHSQIRVYKGPYWDLERIVPHPHRQFQHLTPIKATWHPLVDLVVAGRYPDESFPGFVEGELRTIDIMNPDSGAMECQINQPGFNKISSLNLFSPNGEAMLSGMGQTVLIWKQKPQTEVKFEQKSTNVESIVVEEWPGLKSQVAAKPRGKKSKKV